MCGRFTLTTPIWEVALELGVDRGRIAPDADLPARYNIAPTQPIVVARLGADGQRELAAVRWGFVPASAPAGATARAPINARAESCPSSRLFQNAFAQHRCVVPASGFYEWGVAPDGRKTPYRFHRASGEIVAFAALWERWEAAPDDPKGPRVLESACILTVAASAGVRDVHDRSPAVIRTVDLATWLGGDRDAARALLGPAPDDYFVREAVSRRLGNPRHDDAGLMRGEDDLAGLPLFE